MYEYDTYTAVNTNSNTRLTAVQQAACKESQQYSKFQISVHAANLTNLDLSHVQAVPDLTATSCVDGIHGHMI